MAAPVLDERKHRDALEALVATGSGTIPGGTTVNGLKQDVIFLDGSSTVPTTINASGSAVSGTVAAGTFQPETWVVANGGSGVSPRAVLQNCATSAALCGSNNLNWKDITPRFGMAYDLRGDGKTALKVTFNKYLLGQTLNALGSNPNPVNALVNSATRSWADANRDFVPQCEFTNPAANGESGPTSPATFGSTRPAELYDPDLLRGFGHRMRNWEFSAGLQHELHRGIAVDASYFRRIWGNFQVTDNLAVGPEDFTQFNLTAPSDPRLPGGGGYTLSGLYDVKPEKFGQQQNYARRLFDSAFDVGRERVARLQVASIHPCSKTGAFQRSVQTSSARLVFSRVTDECGVLHARPPRGQSDIAASQCQEVGVSRRPMQLSRPPTLPPAQRLALRGRG